MSFWLPAFQVSLYSCSGGWGIRDFVLGRGAQDVDPFLPAPSISSISPLRRRGREGGEVQ